MSKLINTEDLAHILYKVMPLKALTQLAKTQGKLVYRRGHTGKVCWRSSKHIRWGLWHGIA